MTRARGRTQQNETAQPNSQATVSRDEPEIDRILAESFPASDPPPWTPGVARIGDEHVAGSEPSDKAPPRRR